MKQEIDTPSIDIREDYLLKKLHQKPKKAKQKKNYKNYLNL